MESIKYTLQGAHLFYWQPSTFPDPVIFCSKKALFQQGKAIRGGVPICWPWFGPKDGLAQHGFVRTLDWKLNLEETSEIEHKIRFSISEDSFTLSMFPYKFHLFLDIIETNETLSIALTTTNTDELPFDITSALHTYFHIGDISEIYIDGLQHHSYIDKIDNLKKTQKENRLKINGETDRIYQTSDTTTIYDPILQRKIKIEHTASSIVIWNPWEEKSKAIADLEEDDYKKFICVESAIAPERVTILPQQSHTLKQEISIQNL